MTNPMDDILKKAERNYEPAGAKTTPVETTTHEPPAAAKKLNDADMSTAPLSAVLDLKVVTRVSNLLKGAKTPLDLMVAIKAVNTALDEVAKDNLYAANLQWKKLRVSDVTKNEFSVYGGVVKAYVKPGTYTYDKVIIDKEAEVKQLKAAAKKNKTAVYVPAVINEKKDKLFAVSA